MLSIRQCRYAETHLSFGIAAEVVLEIVVQRVGGSHLSVDDELQVVANTTARSVDAVFIVQQGGEVGRLVDIIAIRE